MTTPDPRRGREPTMDGDDDLQAGQYGPDTEQAGEYDDAERSGTDEDGSPR